MAGGPPIRRLWRDLLFPQMHENDNIFLFLFSLLFDILHDIRNFLICAVFIFLGCVFALILAMREGNNKLCHEVVVVWVCFVFVGFLFSKRLVARQFPFSPRGGAQHLLADLQEKNKKNMTSRPEFCC